MLTLGEAIVDMFFQTNPIHEQVSYGLPLAAHLTCRPPRATPAMVRQSDIVTRHPLLSSPLIKPARHRWTIWMTMLTMGKDLIQTSRPGEQNYMVFWASGEHPMREGLFHDPT